MSKTERLTVDLPAHLVAGLRESVRTGAYRSESAAIEELLLAWYGPEGTKEPAIEQRAPLSPKASRMLKPGVCPMRRKFTNACSRRSTRSRLKRPSDRTRLYGRSRTRSNANCKIYRGRQPSRGATFR